MKLNDPALDHLAVAHRTLLAPYGLDESHLGRAIATILEHRVDQGIERDVVVARKPG